MVEVEVPESDDIVGEGVLWVEAREGVLFPMPGRTVLVKACAYVTGIRP